ncbi:hypothetical protein MFIFM68171_06353 [Madurella fahalii]|uniref:Dynamin N-terminal domain-containing protein n=1 Tax=Madurella fahalii TaxID=1157608 RepID=A0ABQ0GEF3_9PEZI
MAPKRKPAAAAGNKQFKSDPQYSWQSAGELDPPVRIKILEETLEKAASYSTEVLRLIKEYSMSEELRKWLGEVDALKAERLDFEVHVGVQGATGAGKSSLLSALLDCKDLLPSNNAEAATATICKVFYNHDDDPRKAFHAKITFRKRQDVKEELDRFFDSVVERDRLLHPDTAKDGQHGEGDEYDNNDERARAVEELNDHIQDVSDKIKAVWGYTLNQLAKMSTADLLTPDDPTAKLLSSTKSISSSDQETFATEIKPYLDSTSQEFKGKSGAKTRTMAVWPLIDHVDIYLKADILKGGIVLVDLPGLSDIVESRAAVARKHYQNLSVTAIVAPCVRAADERTAVNLMTENQELNMRMDGKFDGHNFCVVLSKTDDIDAYAVGKREGWIEEVKAISDLAEEFQNCDAIAKTCKSTADSLRKAKKGAKDESERQGIEAKIKKLNKTRKRQTKAKKQCRAEFRNRKGALCHHSIQARNRILERRILDHLRQRQEAFLSHSPDASTEFTPAQIFPVSMKAYWGLREKNATAVEGFPKPAYTGIPALAAWLRDATIPHRERHVISLLNRYRGLLDNIQTWSDDECEKNKVRLSAEQIKTEVLDPICNQLLQNLQKYGLSLKKQVEACDPLKNKQNALKQCSEHCNERVARWVFRDPDNANSIFKMHPLTFAAIIRRQGGEFLSRSGGAKQKYHWMEDMAMAFKRQIAGSWSKELHKNIPALRAPANTKINEIWDRQMKALTANLAKEFPEGKKYIMDRSGSLSAIKAEVRDLVGKALIDISRTSAQVHPDLTKRMAEKWGPGFRLANKEKPGRGVMMRRHGRLKKHSLQNGKKIYQESVLEMEKELKAHFEAFPDTLDVAWRRGIERLRTQTGHIIAKFVENEDHRGDADGESSKISKIALQKQVRSVLMRWTAAWVTIDHDVAMAESTAIPAEYVPPKEKGSWSDSDSSGESTMDNDSNSEDGIDEV